MNTPATFFPIPAALQQPHLLDDILAASQHVLSTGSVVVPDIHPLSLPAVHGLYLSRRRMPDDRCELTATNPEAFRQWLNHVWFTLKFARQQFAIGIHTFSLCLMNINVLPAPSDQSRQTMRSEIVLPVSGIITLAIVCLAPFTFLYGLLVYSAISDVFWQHFHQEGRHG